MIREGMEDYEYLKLLADARATRASPRQVADGALPQRPTPTEVPAPATLMAARERIAKRILELRGTPIP